MLSRTSLAHVGLLLTAFVPLACATSPGTPADLQKQIDARYRELIGYGERADGAASAAMYIKDAILLAPDGRVVQGQDEVRKFTQAPLGTEVRDTKIETLSCDGDSRFAYHVGRYEYTVVQDGQESVVRGRYLMVWEKVDGVWKVAADMWDADSQPKEKR